jgi:hypothetical protein
MDPSYTSSEDEAEAMAKAMGFSSFGTQGPTKKRKFNAKIDAMVEGQELAALDRGGKKGQGSGGNNIPLGKPRIFGHAPKSNREEIDLDAEDEDDEEPAYIDTSLPPPAKQEGSEEGEGPAYIDTSLPPPNEDISAAQEKIDAILANSTILPMPPDSRIMAKPQRSVVERGVGSVLTALQDNSRHPLPNITAPGTSARSYTDQHPPRQRGQQNELWYVGYYDPSFNENPWVKLEMANGLEPRGTWIEKGGQGA